MSRRLKSETAPWKPTTAFGAAGDTAWVGFGKATLEIGLAVIALTSISWNAKEMPAVRKPSIQADAPPLPATLHEKLGNPQLRMQPGLGT
jgi:hypothetical protein